MSGYGEFFAFEAGSPSADDVAVITGRDSEPRTIGDSFSSPHLFDPALRTTPAMAACRWPCVDIRHRHFDHYPEDFADAEDSVRSEA